MRLTRGLFVLILLALTGLQQSTAGGNLLLEENSASRLAFSLLGDSLEYRESTIESTEVLRNAWGLDILISNDGFGFGTFYRREFGGNLSGFASFSISESKDDREVERFDPFTQTSFTPGKLNRFLVLPLMFGVQKRMFEEDITESFRPYINAAVGPTMIFTAPFVEIRQTTSKPEIRQIEFFNSLGKGQPHYTVGGYIGFGANFGTDRSNVFGVNFRYYFTYILGDGLPSLYTVSQSNEVLIASRKKDFGGFFITLNVGMAY